MLLMMLCSHDWNIYYRTVVVHCIYDRLNVPVNEIDSGFGRVFYALGIMKAIIRLSEKNRKRTSLIYGLDTKTPDLRKVSIT